MNLIQGAAQFLHETGLLAEINRVVLNPRGLALSIIAEMPGPNPYEEPRAASFGPLYDKRDDEGILLSEKEITRGAALLAAREADGTVPVRPERAARLGFVVQPAPGAPAPASTRPARARAHPQPKARAKGKAKARAAIKGKARSTARTPRTRATRRG